MSEPHRRREPFRGSEPPARRAPLWESEPCNLREPLWQSDMQGLANRFYGSREWKQARAKARARAHWRCIWCGADVRGYGQSRVDHVIPLDQRPDLALVQSNLRVLCCACDAMRHSEKGTNVDPFRGCDADGVPISSAHPWNRNEASSVTFRTQSKSEVDSENRMGGGGRGGLSQENFTDSSSGPCRSTYKRNFSPK